MSKCDNVKDFIKLFNEIINLLNETFSNPLKDITDKETFEEEWINEINNCKNESELGLLLEIYFIKIENNIKKLEKEKKKKDDDNDV